jgi:hypothetical protein
VDGDRAGRPAGRRFTFGQAARQVRTKMLTVGLPTVLDDMS